MKDIASLGDYLRMVAPVDYKSHWAPGEEIKRHAENIGQTIPTVPVFLGPPDEPGEELRKPYQQNIHDGSKPDRKSVVSGKSVSVRIDIVGGRIIKKKNKRDTIVDRQ